MTGKSSSAKSEWRHGRRRDAEFLTYFKLSGPGHVARLDASARPMRAVTVSDDLKRATVYRRDYRADAWISKVIRQ